MNGSEAELVKGRAPVVLAFTALLVASPVLAGDVAVSPDGRNRIEYADGKVTVSRDGRTLFGPQRAALSLDRGAARIELAARSGDSPRWRGAAAGSGSQPR